MAHLNLEERRLYSDIFLQMDLDGNGYLSKQELLSPQCLKLMGLSERDKAAVDIVFRQMDINDDGKVTLDEFFNICKNLPPEVVRLSAIRRAFQKMDLDLDGKISEDELYQAFIDSGAPVTRDDVHNVVVRLDTDGDGKLNPREFVALF